jgi:hypothetical protein
MVPPILPKSHREASNDERFTALQGQPARGQFLCPQSSYPTAGFRVKPDYAAVLFRLLFPLNSLEIFIIIKYL